MRTVRYSLEVKVIPYRRGRTANEARPNPQELVADAALRDHRLSLNFLSLCDFSTAAQTSRSRSSSGCRVRRHKNPDNSVYARLTEVEGLNLKHLRYASFLKSTADNRLPVPFSRSGVQGKETSRRSKSCVFLSGERLLNTSLTPKRFQGSRRWGTPTIPCPTG